MLIEWSDFKVLLALYRGGSVAGAARGLQVDNSTVSRRLAALELAVGARLLLRGGREFCWTAEGRSLLEAARTMETATAGAVRAVRSAKQDLQGSVRVALAPGLLPWLLQLMLPALREAHPALSLELRGAHQRVDLGGGDADIAVRMLRPLEPDLVARQAFECDWYLYAAESYLAARGTPGAADALAGHDLVLYLENPQGLAALKWLEAHTGSARRITRVDAPETACQTISAGGGLAVLPAYVAGAMPQLRRVFDERVAVDSGWVVYHEASRDCSRIRVVADALMAFFRAQRHLFSAGDTQASLG